MSSGGTVSGQRDQFLRQLLEILHDPQVMVIARRRAGDPELAEDALQETYYRLALIKDPSGIGNLRAYFCRVLVRNADELRVKVGLARREALWEEGPSAAAGRGRARARPAGEPAVTRRVTEGWLERFSAQRDRLTASVPGRSPDPERYRDVILAAAERILGAMIGQADSEPDPDGVLRAGYPEWFEEESGYAGWRRLARARTDLRNLLVAVVRQDRDGDPVASAAYSAGRASAREEVRAADDAILSALFRETGPIRLEREEPYNLERELDLFTEWLDGTL